MNQFHSHIGIALECTNTSDTQSLLNMAPVLPLRSIVSVSLLEDHEDISQTPCWLLIVNIEALRALEDQNGNYNGLSSFLVKFENTKGVIRSCN